MARERYRFIAVLINVIFQIIGGIFVFWFNPGFVFSDIGGDKLAQLCLQLAAYSNIGMALVVALILVYAREPRLLRWVAAGYAVYNLLAGINGIRTAMGLTGVTLSEPVFGPAVSHTIMFLIALSALLIPGQKPAQT
ncbi:MAG: hypothetical protein JXB38_21660 [Anaerolineales bacterium]|nr:hypothetical protein [Anaerolineales bacterium]